MVAKACEASGYEKEDLAAQLAQLKEEAYWLWTGQEQTNALLTQLAESAAKTNALLTQLAGSAAQRNLRDLVIAKAAGSSAGKSQHTTRNSRSTRAAARRWLYSLLCGWRESGS